MRLIDADKILEKMQSVFDMQDLYLPVHFQQLVVDDMPTVDAEPVRHGRWIDYEYSHESQCSICGHEWNWINNDMDTFNYCPNCGAKMDEIQSLFDKCVEDVGDWMKKFNDKMDEVEE